MSLSTQQKSMILLGGILVGALTALYFFANRSGDRDPIGVVQSPEDTVEVESAVSINDVAKNDDPQQPTPTSLPTQSPSLEVVKEHLETKELVAQGELEEEESAVKTQEESQAKALKRTKQIELIDSLLERVDEQLPKLSEGKERTDLLEHRRKLTVRKELLRTQLNKESKAIQL